MEDGLNDRITKLQKQRDEKIALLAHIFSELCVLDEEFRGKEYSDEADYKRLNLSLDEATHRTALNSILVRLRNLKMQAKRKAPALIKSAA